jgi:hypothetical protein
MADRTFTLDWRIRTRKNETVVRAKLGTLDTQLSFRKRVRGPVRVDPSMVVPSAPSSWHELGGGDGAVAPEEHEDVLVEPTLRRAIG